MAQTFVPHSSPPQRPRVIFLTAALGLILLALTNPDQEAYTRYAVEKAKRIACEQKSASIGKLSCPILAPLPNGMAAQLLSQYTYRDNYLFFSIYRTKILDTEVQSIGAAGRFW